MITRYDVVAAVLMTSAWSVASAQTGRFPNFEAAAGSAQEDDRATPAAATAPVPNRRSAPAAGVPWNASRQPAKSPSHGSRSTGTPARRLTPAQRGIDPNAKPIGARLGQPDVLKAYELTKTAQTEDAYTQVIDLCRSGMQKGVESRMAAYARKLSAWAYNRRGEARADSGRTQEAFDDFDAAVGMESGQWRAIHNRGVSHAMLGNQEAAIADFTRTLELNPKFANAWFNRGELKYENREFVAAVQDYNQALRLAPRDAAALNSRGHALYRLRRSAEAMADYNKAIEIDPSSAAAFVNRGDLQADQGNFAQAARNYREAIQVNPSLGRAYQSAAWLMATCPEESFRNADLAIEAAQKAIELDGNTDYRYLETLAAAQANAGEFEDAIKTQEQAMETAPDAVVQVYRRRIAEFRAGRPHREPSPKFAAGARAVSRR